MTGEELNLAQVLEGTEITRIAFDKQFRFLFSNNWDLVVNGLGIWQPHGQTAVTIDSYRPADVAASLLAALDTRVRSAIIDPEAQSISVTTGAGVLRVEHQDQYEAWEMYGPNGEIIIATPGYRGLAIWGPRDKGE